MLLDAGATVTVCHSKTRDLPSITRVADILVAAVGPMTIAMLLGNTVIAAECAASREGTRSP
jgi:5,10-methylene-tetrahydrofolate dehydrogenase/methenyl tetrahydrofolate cyclohydrolase